MASWTGSRLSKSTPTATAPEAWRAHVPPRREVSRRHQPGARVADQDAVLRKRGELREFLEIVGDKPVNAYRQADGVNFKDVQLALPIYRQKSPFKGLTLVDAAKKASELRAGGEQVDLLNPITINDKIGTVSLFSNGRSRATAASSTRWRNCASSAPRTSAKARSGTLGPLMNSIACSLRRSTRAAGRSASGSSQAMSCSANQQSTGCRS